MKAVKWILIIGGGLIAFLLVALILIPMFIDVNKHKPRIEKAVSQATGRSFVIGGDLQLSLIPWTGFSLKDLRLGSPDGFGEKDMVTISEFEVKVKLLPLISKDFQVNRFVVKNPRIVLIKNRKGKGNWEGLGASAAEKPPSKKAETEKTPEAGLPIKSLTVGELAVTNGALLWINDKAGTRNEIQELQLVVRDVSMERPVPVTFAARVDNKPLSAEGSVGPMSGELGKGKMPLDLVVKALDQIQLGLKGHIENVTADPRFDLAVNISEFSPRKLMAALGQDMPVQTADPKVLTRASFKARVKGNPQKVALKEGTLILDDSTMTLAANIKDFSRPELWFKTEMDAIDADRYLPPDTESETGSQSPKAAGSTKKSKTDYTPLRKLILDGQAKIGKLKIAKARMENVRVTVKAKGGIIQISPAMALYQGDASGRAVINVTRDTPKTDVRLSAKGLQINPLMKDVMNKDFLEGATEARMKLSMRGDDPESIKKTLGGEGLLLFKDGAIKGIDLASMARNIQSAFGMETQGGKKPRTDFSELNVPVTIQKGVAKIGNAKLQSPFIRVKAEGTANLVSEALDMRVNPKIVGTIKGQGDTKERGGLTVPILVSGTFSNPKFEPDLAGMLTGGSGASTEDVVKGFTDSSGDAAKSVEEQVKGVLKSLPFGN